MDPNHLPGDPFAEYLVTVINDELSKQAESVRTDVFGRMRLMEHVLASYGETDELLKKQFFYFSVSVGPISQPKAIWHDITCKKKETLRPSQARFSYRQVFGTGKGKNRFRQEDPDDPFMRRRTRERMRNKSLLGEVPPRPPETIPAPLGKKEKAEQLNLLEVTPKNAIPPWYIILEQALMLFAFGEKSGGNSLPFFSQAVARTIRTHRCPPGLKTEILSKIQQHQNRLKKLENRIISRRERKREEWEYRETIWVSFRRELRTICKVDIDPAGNIG